MKSSFASVIARAWIIGTLVLLAGCSTVRLAYNSAPQFAWLWLDRYVDFPTELAPQAKDALGQWFAWHRQTRLGEHAALLAAMQARAGESTTPEQMCRWWEQVRQQTEPLIERAIVLAAPVVPQLGPVQWAHIEGRFAKNNAEAREEFLQADPAERRKASVERAVERFERFYGTLDDSQRKLLDNGAAASPFDPEAMLVERRRRQADILQQLRRWGAEKPDAARLAQEMRALVERSSRSPDPAYARMQQRSLAHSCKVAADLHNSTTPAQRQALRQKLKGWEEDLRALAGATRRDV